MLSIAKMIKEGWAVKGNKDYFLSRKKVKVSFDIIVKTQKGMLFCVNIQMSLGEIIRARVDISKEKVHKTLGSSAEEATLATGKELG